MLCVLTCAWEEEGLTIYNKVLITYTVFNVHTLLCIVLICYSYCAYSAYSIVYCINVL